MGEKDTVYNTNRVISILHATIYDNIIQRYPSKALENIKECLRLLEEDVEREKQ